MRLQNVSIQSSSVEDGISGEDFVVTHYGVCLTCADQTGKLPRCCGVPCYKLSQRMILLIIGIEVWKFLKFTTSNRRYLVVHIGVIHGLLLACFVANLYTFKMRYGPKIFMLLGTLEIGLFICHKVLHTKQSLDYYLFCYTALASLLYLAAFILALIHYVRLGALTKRYFSRIETCLPCMVRSNMASRNPLRRLGWILLGIQLLRLLHSITRNFNHYRDARFALPFIDLTGIVVLMFLMVRRLKVPWNARLILAIFFPILNIVGSILIHVFFPPVNLRQLLVLTFSWFILWLLYAGPELMFQKKRLKNNNNPSHLLRRGNT